MVSSLLLVRFLQVATALFSLAWAIPAGDLDQRASQSSKCAPYGGRCGLGPGQASHGIGTNASGGYWPWQTFKTESFNPPVLEVVRPNAKPLAPGYLFISTSNFNLSDHAAAKQSGPIIITDKGELVWDGPTVNPLSALNINNFRVQTLDGRSFLTYWAGFNTVGANIGHGYGNTTFLDTSYQPVKVVCPQLNLQVTGPGVDHACECDIHEQQVTTRGTLLNSFYNLTTQELTSINGSVTGSIFSSGFVDLDIATGKPLFTWKAIDHVPVSDTHFPLLGALGTAAAFLDCFHINSVEHVPALHGYLVNGRHTWETYLVSDTTGAIIWQIQGDTGGDFGALRENGKFRRQHYARAHNVTPDSVTISMSNNYNTQGPNVGGMPTNGLALLLDLPPSKSQPPLVTEHVTVENEPVRAASQGSYSFVPRTSQDEPNDFTTQFLDHGQIPLLREYGTASDGSDLRWEARFGFDSLVQSYRGFKQEWRGRPMQKSKQVVETARESGCGEAQGWVSLNGATEVTGWMVYEGNSRRKCEMGRLKRVCEVRFWRFETQFRVGRGVRRVQVAPVEGGGRGGGVRW